MQIQFIEESSGFFGGTDDKHATFYLADVIHPSRHCFAITAHFRSALHMSTQHQLGQVDLYEGALIATEDFRAAASRN
jgi:hypothetical protein